MTCARSWPSELAIEPGPALRDLHTGILRQDPALDRPAPGEQDAGHRGRGQRGQPFPAPQTRYAMTDDGVHIAYQVLGQGDRDIVFVPGLMSHLDLLWEEARTRPGSSSAWRRSAG